MAKIQTVVLTRHEKEQLEAMLRKGRWSPREIKRAHVLLMADDTKHISNGEIGKRLHLTRDTVRIIRQRFLEGGVEAALFDRPRPGQPKKLFMSATRPLSSQRHAQRHRRTTTTGHCCF